MTQFTVEGGNLHSRRNRLPPASPNRYSTKTLQRRYDTLETLSYEIDL